MNTLTSSFLMDIPLVSLTCLIILAEILSIILNSYRESVQHCLLSDCGISHIANCLQLFNCLSAETSRCWLQARKDKAQKLLLICDCLMSSRHTLYWKWTIWLISYDVSIPSLTVSSNLALLITPSSPSAEIHYSTSYMYFSRRLRVYSSIFRVTVWLWVQI